MRGGDNVFGTGNRHGLLDGAHDGVDGGMKTQSFLDDGLVQRELGQIVVLQRRQVGTQGVDLFLVQILDDLGVLGKTEHDPRAGG